MPRTSRCNYPHHHSGPSAGPTLGWLAALGLGALIVTHWHAVVLVLIVIAVLVALAVPVLLLLHNHGSGYDAGLERQASAERAQRWAAAYSITPAASPSEASSLREAPARDAAALETAPVVHQHVHFHGLNGEDMAEVVRKAISRPENDSPR